MIGSFIGGCLCRVIGLGPTHIVGSRIAAVVGAIVLLLVVGLLNPRAAQSSGYSILGLLSRRAAQEA
jgi:hypothetical protein